MMICFIFSPLLYGATFFYLRRKNYYKNNLKIVQKNRAYKIFLSSLHKLKKKNDNQNEIIKNILESIKIFIGNKLSISGTALTADEIKKILKQKCPEAEGGLYQLMSELEIACYGGADQDINLKQTFQQAESHLAKINKKIK